jgi:hypothetical protein
MASDITKQIIEVLAAIATAGLPGLTNWHRASPNQTGSVPRSMP